MLTTVRIACVADVHAGQHQGCARPTHRPGVNSRAEAVLTALRAAARLAEEHADALVVAGDLMDVSDPSPQLLAATRDALQDALQDTANIPRYLLVGNHDQESARPGDHALGPLHDGRTIHVIDTPQTVDVGPLGLRFAPFRRVAAKDYLPESLRGDPGDPCPTVGVIHAGIEDDNTAPQMRGHHDAIPLGRLLRIAADTGLQAVVAGNWHNHRIWETGACTVVQCGALVPTGWDNPGPDDYGRVTILSFDIGSGGYFKGPRVEVHEIPGPRFLSFPHSRLAEALQAPGESYVALTAAPKAEKAAVQAALEEAHPGRWKVAWEAEAAPEEAQRAAAVVRAEASREGAVKAFVAAMPLPPAVERAQVESLSLGYLPGK